MSGSTKIIGPIKVYLPDENQTCFSIFEDCAELFGNEFQSEAFKLLKTKSKEIKPSPSMDYEGDFISATTTNVDTIISLVEAIIELSTPENKSKFPALDKNKLKEEFTVAKKDRPKPKKWGVGDIFSIPLKDKSYTIGQVLNKPCTCVLYLYRSLDFPEITQTEFEHLLPISIMHLGTGDLLNNGTWQVLFKEKVTLDPDSGHGGKNFSVGSISYGGCGTMADLADAYWGLIPWNTNYKEDYFAEMLFKNVLTPDIKILSASDRLQFRLKNYGVE